MVAGSPVCPLSARPLSTSMGGPQLLLLTTIAHHHLTLTPSSNPGATLIHPRRAGTPLRPLSRPRPCVGRPAPPQIAGLHVQVRVRAPSTVLFFAAGLTRETAPASLLAVRAQLWSWRRGGRDLQMLAGRRFVDCCSVWASTGEGWQDIAPSQQAADGTEGEEGGRREGKERSVRRRARGGDAQS